MTPHAFTYRDPSGEYDVTRQFSPDTQCLRVSIRSRQMWSVEVSKDIPMHMIASAKWADLLIRDEVASLVPALREAVTEAMVYEAMGSQGEV